MNKRNYIGGSDIHHLYNLEPYGCSRQLFYRVTGKATDFDDYETPAMTRGKDLEPLVKRYLERDYGFKFKQIGTESEYGMEIREHGFVGHVDGITYHNNDDGELVEIKTCSYQTWQRYVIGKGIPQSYLLQVQYYMELACLEKCHVVFFLADPYAWGEIKIFEVKRDRDLGGKIVDKIEWFRNDYIEKMKEPECLDFHDDRCKKCVYFESCQGMDISHALTFKNEHDEVFDGSDEYDRLLTDQLDAKIKIKKYTDLKKRLDKELKKAHGKEHYKIRCHTGYSTLSPQVKTAINKKNLEKLYPDAYNDASIWDTRTSFVLRTTEKTSE